MHVARSSLTWDLNTRVTEFPIEIGAIASRLREKQTQLSVQFWQGQENEVPPANPSKFANCKWGLCNNQGSW
jgi:hypothetical protein